MKVLKSLKTDNVKRYREKLELDGEIEEICVIVLALNRSNLGGVREGILICTAVSILCNA